MNRLDTRRAIAFVRALSREMGADAAYISKLRSIIQTDGAVIAAETLLDGRSALGVTPEGTDALRRLADAYAVLYDMKVDTQTAFCQLDRALAEVHKDMERGAVVTPKQLESDRIFWPAYLQALCSVVACLYGTGPLRDLRNIAVAGAADLNELKQAARELLNRTADFEELGCWTISREVGRRTRYFTGAARVVFDWEPTEYTTLVERNDLRPLTFGLAGAKNRRGIVVLAGRGYVVGTKLLDGIKLRSPDVHHTLPVDAFSANGLGSVDQTDPIPALQRYFQDDAFCLHPEQLADALDHLVQMRRGT